MKTINVAAMNRMDHDDVKDIAPREKQRKRYRLRIIKSFMAWANKDPQRWSNQNNDERVIIQRQKSYFRMMMGFGAFSNFFIYQAFFTGIYNYRQRELLNMRSVPIVLKMGVSSTLAGVMCYLLYQDHLYEEDLYRIALKYRMEYDDDHSDRLEKNKIEGRGFIGSAEERPPF